MIAVVVLAVIAGPMAVVGLRVARARIRWRRVLGRPGRPHATVRWLVWLRRLLEPPRAGLVIVSTAGVVGAALGGPVAAAILVIYSLAGWFLLHRRNVAAEYVRDRVAAVDAVSTLAAELRAGLPAPTALAGAAREFGHRPGAGAVAVVARLTSAVELAESTGAPLADVLDRLDAHLRAMDRARRATEAQAAGARASAALLAVLPVAGVGLGYVVGVDPARVLLHTPFGAACLAGAVVLQLAGLLWADRISRVEVPT